MKKWIIVIITLFILLGLIWITIYYSKGNMDTVGAEYANPDMNNTEADTASDALATHLSDSASKMPELTADEQQVLDLINNERTESGLSPLVINSDLENIARLKARDMINKNYFSHQSETYGSPFAMMDDFGIAYKTAGENIAGNPSNIGAVTAWMNSPQHKANILNGSYTYTGVAVVNGSKYGKIFVEEFVGM